MVDLCGGLWELKGIFWDDKMLPISFEVVPTQVYLFAKRQKTCLGECEFYF